LSQPSSVLIVDDDENVLKSIEVILKSSGINNILCCNNSTEVMDILEKQDVDVVLLDLAMPLLTGEELLCQIRKDYPEIPVIIITGITEIEKAVECMKMGAVDYMVKPVERNRLISSVSRGIELKELKRENRRLRDKFFSDEVQNPEAFYEIITCSSKMQKIFQYAETIAKSTRHVLITGETGAGKELIARSIHHLSGRRGSLITVNIAGLDDNLFSDTLFGHKKGAYTGADSVRKGVVEEASGGSLFLDEIGDLNPSSQIKLLRLLENREFLSLGSDIPKKANIRVIMASNKDLFKMVKTNQFRKDLYYRISTYEINVPPLRERKEDIELLVNHFIRKASAELDIKEPAYPPELITQLEVYHFPGNIRELESMIYDAINLSKRGMISLDTIKEKIGREISHISEEEKTCIIRFSDKLPTLKQVTELLIEEALKRTRGNQSAAARLLGVSQQALSKRLNSLRKTHT